MFLSDATETTVALLLADALMFPFCGAGGNSSIGKKWQESSSKPHHAVTLPARNTRHHITTPRQRADESCSQAQRRVTVLSAQLVPPAPRRTKLEEILPKTLLGASLARMCVCPSLLILENVSSTAL